MTFIHYYQEIERKKVQAIRDKKILKVMTDASKDEDDQQKVYYKLEHSITERLSLSHRYISFFKNSTK